MKKETNFKLKKKSRFLPGEVADQQAQVDLKEYNNHRFRVFCARPLVDSQPPKLNPFNLFNKRKLNQDATRLRRIDLENKELLKKISIINRTKGKVDSYNPAAYQKINKFAHYNQCMKKLEVLNRKLYRELKNASPIYSTEKMKKEWAHTVERMKHMCRYPVVISAKPILNEQLREAQSISYLLPCKRPELRLHCYIDFGVKNGKYLGRIIIELYYDQVPVTVQNFLELCKGQNELTYRDSLVHRIILGEYMEMGDITHGTGRGGVSIYGKTFAEENHKLRHTRAGVLSMKRIGWAENNSQFCITFKKMERLDHMNVVFGKVIKGNDLLMNIQYYGRKIGKPLETIIISDCGEYFVRESEKN